MPKATLVTSGATVFTATTTPKTSGSIAVQSGDVVTVIAIGEGESIVFDTPTSTGLTFTAKQSHNLASNCEVGSWTSTIPGGTTTMNISINNSGSTIRWGFIWYVHRGSTGVGNTSKGNGASGSAPSFALTATGANSIIIAGGGDWDAGATTGKTWRTIDGVTPTSGNGMEKVATQVSGGYTIYSALWDGTTSSGSKTVGMTAPNQKWAWVAIEILGTTATTVNGSIATTFAFSATASGTPTTLGSINTTFGFTATASGTRTTKGAIATTFAFTAPASGNRTTAGSINTTFVFAAPASGMETATTGTISTTFAFTATASGVGTRPGSISTTFVFAATAAGTPTTNGSINTTFAFAAPASGTPQGNRTGSINTTFVFTATASGQSEGPFVPSYERVSQTRSSRLLVTSDPSPVLDLAYWVGQRVGTFLFYRVNGITNEVLGELHPLRSPAPTLSHDSTRTIKRNLNISLGVEEAQLIDPIVERITVKMRINGVDYPLGRYTYTDQSQLKFTIGKIASLTLLDEMFIVDQQLDQSFSASIGTGAQTAMLSLRRLMDQVPIIRTQFEASTYAATGAWNAGSTRGQVIDALTTQGDYFPPWFGNDEAMHFIRAFDPVLAVPTFNWDEGRTVFLGNVTETNDLLNAPNRFVVISNSGEAAVEAIVGTYDVPSSAPHSIANRGFVISDVQDMQLSSLAQAVAVAKNLGIRQTIFERREIVTAIDPRHDSYDVIRWDGENWLELAWSMTLLEGEGMSHVLRKAYR
jgi:hypothetical protein